MSETIARFLYRWRIALTLAAGAGAVLLAPGARITRTDNEIAAWFSPADPIYRDYERFREEFGSAHPFIIALRSEAPAPGAPAGAGVFTRERLAFLEQISEEIERIPAVQRVQGLATTNIVRALPSGAGEDAPGGLEVQPLLKDLARRSPEEIRRIALADPLIRRDLVSEDGTVTALVVSFDEERVRGVRGELLDRIHRLVDSRLPPGLAAYYNGTVEITETYNRVTLENQRTFVPPIMAITLLAVYALFRSLTRTLIAFLAVLISVLWTLGLYSLMGFSHNILASMLTPLIVVLAISDDVHIIQHYDAERQRGTPEHAFRATLSHLLAPLLGASGTTALGLLSLASSDVVAVREFGIGAGVGVMVDFAISLVFVPTLLGFVAPLATEAPHEKYLVEPLRRAAGLALGRPRAVLAAAVVLGAVAVAGMGRLRVDTNHIRFFASSHPLSRSAAVIDRELAGVYSFNVHLEGPPDSMKAPDVVQRIDRLAGEIARLPAIGKVTSVADYVKRTHKELRDGDPAAAVVSDDPFVVAQELLVFSLAEEGRRELERVVSSDFSQAQIAVKLPSMSSDLVFERVHAAEGLAAQAFAGTPIRPTVTGSGRLYPALDHYLVVSQISSFGTAFVTVFGVIFLVFRSVRFGLLAIVPNLFPVLAVLGMMGWLDITVNVATVMVASVALGVVDDDTVHFISRFRRETSAGAGVDEAVETAAIFEGRAALTTAVVNSCGFAVLGLSEYKPSGWFGGLLALTLAVAFLAEVFVLPATIKLLPRFFGASSRRRARVTAAL